MRFDWKHDLYILLNCYYDILDRLYEALVATGSEVGTLSVAGIEVGAAHTSGVSGVSIQVASHTL